MMWWTLLATLRRVPPLGVALCVGALLMTGAAWRIGAYGDARERAGYARATRGAAFDSTLAATFARERIRVVQRTDTLVQRITVTRHRVDTLIAAVPDSVRTLPSVAPLVVTVQLLTTQVDSLTQQIDTERAAHQMEREVLAAQNRAAHTVIAVQQDSMRALRQRPTWRRTIALTLGGVVLGVAGGLAR